MCCRRGATRPRRAASALDGRAAGCRRGLPPPVVATGRRVAARDRRVPLDQCTAVLLIVPIVARVSPFGSATCARRAAASAFAPDGLTNGNDTAWCETHE